MENHIHSLQNISEHIQSKTDGIEGDYSKMSASWEHLVTSDDDRGLKVIGLIKDQLRMKEKSSGDPATSMNSGGCWCWKATCTDCAPLSVSLFHLSSTLIKIANSSKEYASFDKLADQLRDLDREIRRYPVRLLFF